MMFTGRTIDWQAVLLAFGLNMLINTVVMWVTARKIHNVEEAGIFRCFLCCIQLQIVAVVSLFVLFFPIAIVRHICWLITWYKLSKWVVEASFDPRDGVARSILIVYLLFAVGINAGLYFANGGSSRQPTRKMVVYSIQERADYCDRFHKALEARLDDDYELAVEEEGLNATVTIMRPDSFAIEFASDEFFMKKIPTEQAVARVVSLMNIPPGEMRRLQLERTTAMAQGKKVKLAEALALGIPYQCRYDLAKLEAAEKARAQGGEGAPAETGDDAETETASEDPTTTPALPILGIGMGAGAPQ